ncbi:MAG: nitrogenase component 1 [Lachnospiraceae bacterium]
MSDFLERPRTACALAGALSVIGNLPDVIPIVHTSLGCGGNLANSVAFGSGYLGGGYCNGAAAPSTGVTETEIVFGGVDRLQEQIKNTLELIDGKLYVVATGCMTEMIGDDTAGVVSEFRDEGYPILAVSTPSFKGDSYHGYDIVLDGIFNQFLPKAEEKNPKLVNIFGLVPGYDPFFRGDLEEIERLLTGLGLEVNTFFTPGQTFENLTCAPSAALNIVLSRVWGVELAEKFKERHGTPYWVTDLPIGPDATDQFLTKVAERFGLNADAAIEKGNRDFYGYFERTADAFCDQDLKFYAITVTNATYAIPLARYVTTELGWVHTDSFVTDKLQEEQQTALQGDIPLKFATGVQEIARAINTEHPRNRAQRYFDELSPLYIIGSTLEKRTAAARGAKHLSVSFPTYDRLITDRGYAGYRGGLHLFEDLIGQLMSVKS